MNEYQIIHILDKLISGNPDIPEINELNDQTDLVSDYSFDSLSIIQLVVKIEEKFNIEINDEFLNLDYLRNYKWWKDFLIKTFGENHE
jgi:acyl carrier protein